MRPKVVLVVLVAGFLVGGPGAARAQFVFEHIADYEELITIEGTGDVLVQEMIEYDFGSSPRHGIFRDIPVRYDYDETYERITPLDVVSVDASGGASADYVIEHSGGIDRIKIGDPDETVTGRHVYRITYRVAGALNAFQDHDELYWNAIGPDWTVPIEKARVSVTGPAEITDAACYTGYQGSNLACSRSSLKDGIATFAQNGLAPYQGLTVVVGLPKGALPPSALKVILDERWSLSRAFAITPLTGSLALLLLIAAVGGFAWIAWKTGRDRRFVGSAVDIAFGTKGGPEQSVPMFEQALSPVEYAPPDGLRPGQVGTLIDEVANPLDVSATIVDLAVRKYLVIEEVPKVGIFGKPDWKLTKLKEPDGDLLDYEKRLMEGIFRDGSEVTMSDLRTTFAARLAKVQESLYADAMREKWFTARPDKIRLRYRVIGFLAFIVADGLLVALVIFTHLALLAVPLVIGGLLLLVGAKRMPRRTANGTGTLRRVLGFKRFIDGSEADRSKFAERANIFSEYLPFAIVFGCTDKWAKVFEQLGQKPPDTSWYVSANLFTVVAFSESIDGFSVNTAGSIASTPASSGGSGFSGGGSSGGGFGGGGGGSW